MISEAVLGSVTNTAEDENAEQERYGLHRLLFLREINSTLVMPKSSTAVHMLGLNSRMLSVKDSINTKVQSAIKMLGGVFGLFRQGTSGS